MPRVIKLEDQNTLVSTSEYIYATFPKFTHFNPVQSRIMDIYDKDANVVIAAATSAGKTVCAELMMAHEVRKRGGKAMYLAPMRALAKQKIDDWSARKCKHHFSDLRTSICTGDYRLTPERKRELDNSQLIVMTTEMLNSRCRNFTSENNEFLRECNTVIVDESHLLTVADRGDKLEVGLMKFTELNPNARIIFLSATMPNTNQMAEWLIKLTGRDTYLLDSKYRPCPLGIHYETYWNKGKYDDVEGEKVSAAIGIVENHPDDKFLLFVHTKRTGELLKNQLIRAGVPCEFHNADLEGDKRHEVEDKFQDDPNFKVIIATSTLAWGMNMPARRVIIVGPYRGLSSVEGFDIQQECGRAGRVGLDPRGDAYILLPESEQEMWKKRLANPEPIRSRLLEFVGDDMEPHYKTLAFHIVSEVHHGTIETKDDFHKWYEKSLACYQANDLDDEIIDNTLELLLKCGAIREEDGKYTATVIGKISSSFFYSPFDVSDLKRNFSTVFQNNYDDNDAVVSVALGNIDTLKMGITSKAEREEMGSFSSKVQAMFCGKLRDSSIKGAYAYFCLMNGLNPTIFAGFMRTLQFDFPRTAQVLSALDNMLCKWNRKDYFYKLQGRIAYGVRAELIDLCRLPNIAKVRADKLWNAGIKTIEDVANNPDTVASVLKMKGAMLKDVVEHAKLMAMGIPT